MIFKKSKVSIFLAIIFGVGLFVLLWINEYLLGDCVINLSEQIEEIERPKGDMSPEEFTIYRNKIKEREKLIDEKISSGELKCS